MFCVHKIHARTIYCKRTKETVQCAFGQRDEQESKMKNGLKCDVQPPKSLLKPIHVPHKLLMGPGPSNCSPRVLYSSGLPVLGHMHAECFQIMDEIKDGLQYVFQTNNVHTMAISATGHGGMEAAVCNLLEPGEVILIASNGHWGIRASDIAKRHGGDVRTVKKELGENFTLAEIEAALETHKPAMFFITQGESSTGVYQPIEGLGALCHQYDCLLIVDTVASLGGVPMYADQWEVDVIYTGSQKVLGAPPGLAPISFSQRAWNKIEHRKTPIDVYYFDMKLVANYWGCDDKPRGYHHTVPANALYTLREGLAQVAEEGIEKCWKRHVSCAQRLHEGLKQLGFELFVQDEEARLPTVTTVKIPLGLDAKALSTYAMNKYLVEIAGGLGPSAGQVMRIGLMGYNASYDKVDYVLQVVKECMEHANVIGVKL